VPVHDALRDAVAGVAAAGRASIFLNADGMPAIRFAKQPAELLQVGHLGSDTFLRPKGHSDAC